MQYDDTNKGVLFKNDKKGNEKAPDYTGKMNVNGKEMRLAAWIREGAKGKFMSLSLSEQQEKKPSKTEPSKIEDMDEDVPF